MNAKALALATGVVALGAIAVRFGPPNPGARWVPAQLSRLVLSLQDSFDRYDGIGVPCANRILRPMTIAGHLADVPSCWKVEDAPGGAKLTDPDLNAMPAIVTVAAKEHAVSTPPLTLSVAEKAGEPVPSDEHVWVWSDGACEVTVSTVVPRIVSLAPKVHTHLESIDTAVRSLR